MILLLTVLALGVMIFVHELGHFLVARAFGVGIESFSLGFGKPLFKRVRNGITYRIGWIPLGGYVKMQGENPDDPDLDEQRSFRRKAWWKKVLIAFSGPFANLLLGLLLFIVSYLLPIKMDDLRPIIHQASGKWSALFSPGDSLVSVNGKPVKGFNDFLENLYKDKGGKVVLSRNGTEATLSVKPGDVDSLLVSLTPQVDTSIGEVVPKTPAYHADLRSGDVITAVDSVDVADWYAMRERITGSPTDSVTLTVRRGNTSFQKHLTRESTIAGGNQKTIGIFQNNPISYIRELPAGEAVTYGAANTLNFVTLNYQMLLQLAKKPEQLQKSMGGPVMIATLSNQMGRAGINQLLLFFGSISLMLMIMNLLPIPILDGGLILFAIVEGIIRRPIPLRLQAILQSIGFFLLMFLMVFAFYSDISSLIMRTLAR